MEIPDRINSESELDDFMSAPYPETVEMMKRLDGDIVILGVSGKMGPSLAALARRACQEADVQKRIIGVARFSDLSLRHWLEDRGVETIVSDLSEPEQIENLPRAANILFMAGRKFGDVGSEPLTWVMNNVVPGNVGRHFRGSRTVAFSTGCVYELLPDGGSSEKDQPAPVGEYANSCLGRERIFEHYCQQYNSPTLLYRLNYAMDLRYGVLVDIAEKVANDQPVDLSVGKFNVIWQGDANNRALLCLEHANVPAVPLNITGTELLFTKDVAEEFGKLLGKEVRFTGSDSSKAYLSDASRSIELFGPPRVSVEKMIGWIAQWIKTGNKRLNKPTHFTVTDGQFLDEGEVTKSEVKSS